MLKLCVFLAILGAVFAQKPRILAPEEIERLKAWEEGDQNVWELSGQTEGDMILLPNQKNGLINQRYRWPRGEIPYEIHERDFTSKQIALIHEVVKDFARKSCVIVRPRTKYDTHYVNVTGSGDGCYSYVGYLRKPGQRLNLSPRGCVHNGTIIHEFMHAIGFHHQHSTPDRNEYIKVIIQNIRPGKESNFKIRYNVTQFGQKYDYGSVMHYSERAFSHNNKPTIVPKDPKWINKLGRAKTMSFIDVAKLKRMYGC